MVAQETLNKETSDLRELLITILEELRRHDRNESRRSKLSKVDAISLASAAGVLSFVFYQLSGIRSRPMEFLSFRGLASLAILAIAVCLAVRGVSNALVGAMTDNQDKRVKGLADLPSTMIMILLMSFLIDLYAIWSAILGDSPWFGHVESIVSVLVILFAFLAGWLRSGFEARVREFLEKTSRE